MYTMVATVAAWCVCVREKKLPHIQDYMRKKTCGTSYRDDQESNERTNEKRRRYNLMGYIQWMHYTYFIHVHGMSSRVICTHNSFASFNLLLCFWFRSIFHNIHNLYFYDVMTLWAYRLFTSHQFSLAPLFLIRFFFVSVSFRFVSVFFPDTLG